MDPKPTKELVSCGVEMMLDKDNEERQPMDPKPTKELVSCGVEMMLDKDNEEKEPMDPKPTKELVKIAFVALTVVETYCAVPRPVTVEASSKGSMKLVI